MGIEQSEQADKNVILRVINGDKEAFRILFDRYAGMWFMFAFNLCGNYDTAADLVQEALIKAYQSLDRLKEPSSFPSWVAGIIKNTYRNLERKKSIPSIPLEDIKDKIFVSPDSDTSHSYSKEERAALNKYIEALPDKYKEVVMLRYADDYSYKKIAEILNVPETTVTMRLAYARKILLQNAKEDGLL